VIVDRLELADFRNIVQLAWSPSPGLNLVLGPNAQGKTSLLESVYVLATTKSHRTRKDSEWVRFGAPACRIVASVVKGDPPDPVQLEVAVAASGAAMEGDRKRVRVDHVSVPRTTDLLGHLVAVLFSSTDIDIVRGEPGERRRYLDFAIAQTSPRYALALGAYRRTLEQRNRLLKDLRRGAGGDDSLGAWDAALVTHGARMIERRHHFVRSLAPHAARIHEQLTDGAETLVVGYRPSVSVDDGADAARISEAFLEQLARLSREEKQRGSTLAGPQRDDLSLCVGKEAGAAVDVRTYGSQGQQRTAALSLRLAERAAAEGETGDTPVVLLDDVLSDLDEYRRSKVLEMSLSAGQVMLSATDTQALPPGAVASARRWRMQGGVLEEGK
jgi:DNA replication and repair protein RecF